MNFAEPKVLWLLLVVGPLLSVFLWWSWKQRIKLSAAFIQSRLLAGLTVGVSRRIQKFRLVSIVLAVLLLLTTLARPQWGFSWEEAHQRGRDIIVAIDTSRSMLAGDIPPNRLARAKLAALDLTKLARTDRLGLIAFAGTAFLQAPLTLDDEAFRQSVNILEPGIIPEGGSSIADAIDAALAAFKEGENHKVLVLFSDGEEHEPAALEAAKKAAEKGLRIFTIGVGTPNGELIRVKDEKGAATFIKDDKGNAVKSSLNEKLLQQIGTVANGFYLPLQGARTMEVLYQRGLAPLAPTDSSTQLIKQFKERFQWPLGAAILLLLAEIFVPERPRRQPKPVVENRGLREAVALVLFALFLPSASAASSSRALREYRSGNYQEAQKEFERLLSKKPDDARLHYNAGAAAYQNRDFEKASREFETALNTPDLKLQQKSYYNLGNSEYKRGDAETDPNKKIETWEMAAKHYDSAFKLDAKDDDARYNRDLVRKKIEEVKKQQPPTPDDQNQKDNKDDKDKKDEKDQKDQKDKQDNNQKDQNQSSQDKQDQDKKDQSEQKSDQQKQQQQQQQQQAGKEDEEKKQQQQQQQAGQKPEEGKDQKQANQANQGEPSPEKEGEAVPVQLGKMSPEQARQLLETAKGEEKALLFIPPSNNKERSKPRIFKDW